jgi:hypothetical protein
MPSIVEGCFIALEAADNAKKELTIRHIKTENIAGFYMNVGGVVVD